MKTFQNKKNVSIFSREGILQQVLNIEKYIHTESEYERNTYGQHLIKYFSQRSSNEVWE